MQSPPVPSPAATPDPARSPRRRRRGLIGTAVVLALLAVVALAWYLVQREPAAPAGARPGGRAGAATTVGTAVAARADVPITVEALGTVTPAATVTVRPQVSGVLQQVLFKEGQLVRRGQLLATIDPRQFEMALMQASGQRQRDEAQLENARLTLQRYRTLLAQDSIARQDVDTQAALVRQLEGTATTNRANEGTARLNLGYSRIVAPIAGRVGLRVVDIGNVVGPGDANGLATITQTAPIDVEFSLPQDRVPEVQAQVAAGAALPVVALDRTRATELATGRFSTLDNQVDVQTGTVRAKARFENQGETLFPNQFVNVRLQLRTIEGAVVVPVAALRNRSSGDFVYVLDRATRTVALRPVTRGPATDDQVVITRGLQAGETVITEGADRLKDGARVVLPGDAPASGAGGGRRERGARPGAAASGAPAMAPREGVPGAPRDAASGARRRASDAGAP